MTTYIELLLNYLPKVYIYPRSYNLDDMRKYQILKGREHNHFDPQIVFWMEKISHNKNAIAKKRKNKKQKRFLTYFLLFHLVHKMYKK